MRIALIIVTFKRIELLKNCLDSIPKDLNVELDIFVVINGHDEPTINFIKNASYNYFNVDAMTPGEARNYVIDRLAKNYDYIGFADDDIIFPESYFEILKHDLISNHWDVIGGPDSTYPNSSSFEQALGISQKSPLASANSVNRHSSNSSSVVPSNEKSLILCSLWFKSIIFQRGFRFNKRYFRNEENVLLHKLEKENYRIGYSSKLFVFHKRKESLKKLFKAVSSSGYFRLKSFYEFPDSSSIIYFIPMLFVIYLISLPLFSSLIFLLPLFIYLIINLIFSFVYCLREKKMNLFLKVIVIQFIINIAYGLGFLRFIYLK